MKFDYIKSFVSNIMINSSYVQTPEYTNDDDLVYTYLVSNVFVLQLHLFCCLDPSSRAVQLSMHVATHRIPTFRHTNIKPTHYFLSRNNDDVYN